MRRKTGPGFRTLRTAAELAQYAELTHKHLGIRFPLEYLRKSKITGYFGDEGEMLGGYAMVLEGPFRVLESLPDSVRGSHPFFKTASMDEVCEFTGLWLTPEMRKRSSSVLFWLRMYFDVVTLGKKHFVYAYSLDKRALGRLYRVCNPTVLFQGMTKIQPGMPKPEAESVEVTSISRVIWSPFVKPQFLLYKMLRKRTLSENLAYMRALGSSSGS
jgi:hypothetical protein